MSHNQDISNPDSLSTSTIPIPSSSSTIDASSSSSSTLPDYLSVMVPSEINDNSIDPQIEQRFQHYYTLTLQGNNFTETLRKKKDFCNPYFLKEILNEYAIQEYGSNYPTSLYDPTNYNDSEYAIQLLRKQEEDELIRKQQQETRTKINFIHKGNIPDSIEEQNISNTKLSSSSLITTTTTETKQGGMENVIADAVARSISVANTVNSNIIPPTETIPISQTKRSRWEQ